MTSTTIIIGMFGVSVLCVSANAETVYCATVPGKGPFVYRDVEGRRWFPANGLRRGSEKPLEELKWPRSIPAVEFENRANA